jgi:hypothetical protein
LVPGAIAVKEDNVGGAVSASKMANPSLVPLSSDEETDGVERADGAC